ncbi:ribbon-helix-helix domain-containing protein [Thalassobaculum sp.]|uniref:ribbon-helix-helix domain-containing protein n=1 Tax=Thalassobaculum sp. TaxID=2022740 RepID=UPI0032ED87CC
MPRNAAEVVLGKDGRDARRLTTTVSRDQAERLEEIAERNGVSVSWLLRRAAERLIEEADGGPLLPFLER